jgi:CheY-like chemotaxis protein
VRVVVIEERRLEREAIARALRSESWSAETFADRQSGLAALRRDPPDVVVLGWMSPGGAELLRLAREASGSGTSYFLVVLDPGPRAREIAALMDGGGHDFVIRPIVPEVLVARVQAPTRLRKWALALAAAERQLRFDVGQLRAWQVMGDAACQELRQMIGHPIASLDGWPDELQGPLRGATITMSLTSVRLEFRVSVIADEPSLAWLGEALLGDVNAESAALDDLLRELANTAGGSLKRAALAENVTLTAGIPATDAAARPRGEGVRCWAASIGGGLARLAIVGEVRQSERVCIAAWKLREGMVVTTDLRNGVGALLVPAGTRLTSTAVERVTETLGSHFVVEVADVTSGASE